MTIQYVTLLLIADPQALQDEVVISIDPILVRDKVREPADVAKTTSLENDPNIVVNILIFLVFLDF